MIRRVALLLAALVASLGIVVQPPAQEPAKANHVPRPTAPIENVEIIATDLETGAPVDCNGGTTTARALLLRGFVTVADVPSEHWDTGLNVKTKVATRKPLTSGKSQWNAMSGGQNHGQDFPSEPGDPFFVAGNRMEFIIVEQLELTTFEPMLWRINVKLTGDESGREREAFCLFATEGQPAANFPIADHPLMDLPGPPTHSESAEPIVDFTVRAGTYPGVASDPNRCDGTDTHDGSMRIEPLAHYVDDPPTEHWDFHLQFIRFGNLAWSVAWPHQNFGHDKIGNKGEVGQLNNYDFGTFAAGDYELRMRLAGQHSGIVRDLSCPFPFG
jgi:hypothetical protein